MNKCGANILIPCLLSLLPSAHMVAQSWATADYAHVKLEATKPVYTLGQQILINIMLSNPTNHDLRFAFMHTPDQGDAYNFVVTPTSASSLGDAPTPLERTDEGKEYHYYLFGGPAPPKLNGMFMGGLSGPLQPNHTKVFTTDLARMFKFTEPGVYKVQVEDIPHGSPVEPITITVTR